MIKNSIYLFVLLISINFCSAQSRRQEEVITNVYAAKETTNTSAPDSIHYYIVNFKGGALRPLTGYQIVKRLSLNLYIVSSAKNIVADESISSAVYASSLWKATDDLAGLTISKPNSKKLITLVVKQINKGVVDRIARFADISSVSGNNITIKIRLSQLPILLNDGNITFATPVRKAYAELSIPNLDLGVNAISAIADKFPGINGAGINVSLKEDSYDDSDLDLLGRSFGAAAKSANTSSHANIMATLLGGNGNSYIKGLGAAPAVKFTSSDFARLLPDSNSYFTNFHISLQNHSYGTGIENYYGIEALAYDQQLFENDTLVHVFSSGNIGTSTPADGLYNGVTGVANLSGTFKQAKNVLVAGGTGRTNVTEALSSSGPTYDGRVKPELVADGEDGTSGAAALTSGTIALLQQAYKKQYHRMPASALLKSVLINSADDLGLPAVDFKTGYGKLNALEAMRTITDGRFQTGVLKNQQQQTYLITVPPNCGMLKVSLAWNDPPASLNAPFALINDLDLSVKTAAGVNFLPWTLSSYPNTDSLQQPAIRKKDTINNTEQVTLTTPPPGVYTIVVNAGRVSNGTQTYHVAYQTKQANHFEWTYPSGNNQLFAAEDNYLRWESYYSTSGGKLSVSYDHGNTWQPIENVVLAGGFYKWSAPDSFSQAILKMTINGEDYLSPEFTLTKPLSLNVGFNCTDRTLLHWSPQPGALYYNVYTIKDNILQSLITVKDTSVIIPAQQQASKYFAVSALGNGFEGLKSFTIDATAQGVGCYVKTLLADITTNSKILLTLSLGSVLNLKDITWEKQTGAAIYKTIGATSVDNSLNYQFTDPDPKNGINYYRAKINSNDGQTIYSELASAVLLGTNQFTIYPNPVYTQVNILAGELNTYEFKMYDTMGLLRLSKTFNGLQNAIPVNLIPGTYISTISLNGTILYKGKIVKL
ncbi:hypothetical protein A0256_01845 [Mucilaginibacter sp. PAMC 26640]|nr:hypothetical protein A0256_01845 [Mucilaginibacter sp. PAMC 26640]